MTLMRPLIGLAMVLGLSLVAPRAARADEPPSTPRVEPKKPARKARPKVPADAPVASYPTFEMLDDGRSRVSVSISKKVAITEQIAAGHATYVLEGTYVDGRNDENALETYFHNTPVLRAQLRRGKKDADLHLELRADIKPSMRVIDQDGGGIRLELTFAAGSYPTDGSDVHTPDAPPPRKKPEAKARPRPRTGPAIPAPRVGPEAP